MFQSSRTESGILPRQTSIAVISPLAACGWNVDDLRFDQGSMPHVDIRT
jgi:hypothetical protein